MNQKLLPVQVGIVKSDYSRIQWLLLMICLVLFQPYLSYGAPTDAEDNFLVIGDIHLNIMRDKTMNFAPSDESVLNELDQTSLSTLLNEVQRNIESGRVAKPKFIIVLGDLVTHFRVLPNIAHETESQVFNQLLDAFPKIPIFYVFGNNDSLYANYGPFTDNSLAASSKSPYDIAQENSSWRNGFMSTGVMCTDRQKTPCLMRTDPKNGYYSAYIAPKLQLIVLNSVQFSPKRVQVTDEDAINQLNWLETQLHAAKKNHEQVLLAMHVPPGKNIYDNSDFWQNKEQIIFLNLLQRYQTTVIGLLAAHTHEEEIKIIQNSENQIITATYFTASLSTDHANSPSIKTFYYSKMRTHEPEAPLRINPTLEGLARNQEKWALKNYQTYYFTRQGQTVRLHPLYNYNDYYCQNEIDFLHECLGSISAKKMSLYYYAGNKNREAVFKYPDNLYLVRESLPRQNF